ncbi:MAG: hypothetical protein KDH96_07010 [Candidatus Riesia sp.]|nr:hypothetical protein [Candidatus Riesia sp.]
MELAGRFSWIVDTYNLFAPQEKQALLDRLVAENFYNATQVLYEDGEVALEGTYDNGNWIIKLVTVNQGRLCVRAFGFKQRPVCWVKLDGKDFLIESLKAQP